MSFELKPNHELVAIAAAGGGFTLRAGLKPTHEIVQIAAAAANGGARITFTGMAMRPQHELVQIASAGRGNIILEE